MRIISGKQNGQTHTDYKDIADHIQQRILGNGLEVGEDPFKDTHDKRHQYGAVDGLGTKLRSDQDKADDQQPMFIINVMVETERGMKLLSTMARAAPLPTETWRGSIKKKTAAATMAVPTVMIANSLMVLRTFTELTSLYLALRSIIQPFQKMYRCPSKKAVRKSNVQKVAVSTQRTIGFVG